VIFDQPINLYVFRRDIRTSVEQHVAYGKDSEAAFNKSSSTSTYNEQKQKAVLS